MNTFCAIVLIVAVCRITSGYDADIVHQNSGFKIRRVTRSPVTYVADENGKRVVIITLNSPNNLNQKLDGFQDRNFISKPNFENSFGSSGNLNPNLPGPNYPGLQYPRPNYPGPNYPLPNYPGPLYPIPNYPGSTYPRPNYPGPIYPGPNYPGPNYPGLYFPGLNYNRNTPGSSGFPGSIPIPESGGYIGGGFGQSRSNQIPGALKVIELLREIGVPGLPLPTPELPLSSGGSYRPGGGLGEEKGPVGSPGFGADLSGGLLGGGFDKKRPNVETPNNS